MERTRTVPKHAVRLGQANGPGTKAVLAQYRLGRAALDQRQFLAVELAALVEVPLNTVYSFIAALGDRVTSEPVATASVGRPWKLYSLTDEGVDHPLDQDLEIARILRHDTPAETRHEAAPVEIEPAVVAETLFNEVRGLVEAERQYAKTLPALTKAATPSELKARVAARVKESEAHIHRLERLRDRIDRMRGRDPHRGSGAGHKTAVVE